MIGHVIMALWAAMPLAVSTPSLTPNLGSRTRTENKTLPIYWDPERCVDDRVDDLLQRMTLEEKAGQMFHQVLLYLPSGEFDPGNEGADRLPTEVMLNERLMTHFNLAGGSDDARGTAEFLNRVQAVARSTRLGIPVTVSTDPRHSFTENIGTGFAAGQFSQWPEALGLAATRDPELVLQFAEIMREEYRAVGIRCALHPTADLATEPRWARIQNTWGEDAHLTAEMIVPYINGLHGREFGAHSVSTVTKHFPGGGAMENGEDAHFEYGKNATYPGNNFDYHLIPFKAAFAAGARQIMPYYSRPINTSFEPVGWGFNKGIITDLLRNQMGFQGIVLSDWSLIHDSNLGQPMPARAWGVEHLSYAGRMTKALDAGVDQFGGEHGTDLLIELVKNGTVLEERLDRSVRLLLREKFLLGLFENPFVDPDAAERIVGNDYFKSAGAEAQRRSYTLLTNNNTLPLKHAQWDSKFYIEGFNKTYMEKMNLIVVDTPEEADYALMRINAPSHPRNGTFERSFNSGSLEFSEEEKARQAAIYSAVPTIVDIWLTRPGVVPEIFEQAAAVVDNYGSGPDAFLDVVFGISKPEGRLPFEMPRSMTAVEAQKEDVPYDSENPIFKFGYGLSYEDTPCKSCSTCRKAKTF